jgi:threonine/homoserine/homoserine lactone efflux protein
MVTLDRLLPFTATAFALIVIPGPSVLFVVGRALAHGRRAALATVLGNASGVYLQAVGVAIGIGALVQRSIALFTVLRLAGALYLVFLGAQAIANRRSIGAAGPAVAVPPDTRRRFREGFIVGATNPKGFVPFSAILPQFVDRSAGTSPCRCSSSPSWQWRSLSSPTRRGPWRLARRGTGSRGRRGEGRCLVCQVEQS